jgi:hypothetical protein
VDDDVVVDGGLGVGVIKLLVIDEGCLGFPLEVELELHGLAAPMLGPRLHSRARTVGGRTGLGAWYDGGIVPRFRGPWPGGIGVGEWMVCLFDACLL